MSKTHKLTTVLFADIAGYTTLMQEDETKALALLERFKELLEKIVPDQEGEITQYFGDGCLLNFESATKGAFCAITLQREFVEKNIPVRIGMHLGEVIFTNQNAFGDGVNIASRIESMGVPGAVLISKAIYDQIKNKKDFSLISVGKYDFKNVSESIQVFALVNDGLVLPKRGEMKGKFKERTTGMQLAKNALIYLGVAWVVMELFNFSILHLNLDPLLLDVLIIFLVFGLIITVSASYFKGRWNKRAIIVNTIAIVSAFISSGYFVLNPLSMNPSALRIIPLTKDKSPLKGLSAIAVLPFSNYMGDDSQEYLLSGMHDGLISELGKLGNLRVISRTSTLQYENSNKNILQIGSELDVDAIIETSLTRVDSMVELKMKLIKLVPKESIVWDHSYSIHTNMLPNLFREITINVAQKIDEVALPQSEKLLAPQRVPKPGAYEASLRGFYYIGLLTKEGFELAEQQFRRVIEIDSLYATGYSGLAGIIASQRQMGFIHGDHLIPTLDSLAQIMISLDSTSADILSGLAAHNTWTKFDWDKAEGLFKKSIEINPNNAPTRAYYAHFLMIQNRWKEAWEQMNIGMALDPQDPWVLGFSAAMFGFDGKILSAVKQADKLIKLAPENPLAQQALLKKYIAFNDEEKAIRQLIKVLSLFEIPRLEEVAMNGFAKGGFLQGVEDIVNYLESDANDYFVRPILMLNMYQLLDNKAKQEEWLVKMHEISDPNLPYLVAAKGESDSKVLEVILRDLELWDLW
jgi:TolB-like protein